MPEGPLVVTLFRHEWESLERLARRGEAWAAEQIEQLWQAYRDQHLPCFLCGKEAGWPVYTQIIPRQEDHSRLYGVPLCKACAALPSMVRINKSLGQIYSPQKKEVNFDLSLLKPVKI
jgi:hypothetical protein